MTANMKTLLSTCAAAAVLVAGCAAAYAPQAPDGWAQTYLTRDGSDVTAVTSGAGGATLRVDAPSSNMGVNSRSVLADLSAGESVDQASCVTATHSGLPAQEGVALRIRTTGGVTTAITVTKNIWLGATGIYNVHLWDTSMPGALPGRQLTGFNMAGAVDGGPAPRRLCARVTGLTLELKVWTATTSEPEWGDAVHTRSVELPAGWAAPGVPGVYIGHLPAGGWAELTT